MSDERFEKVRVYVDELKRQTEKAALCLIDGEEVWLPWSQIDEQSDIETDGDSGDAYIPLWLAEEKGLDYDEA